MMRKIVLCAALLIASGCPAFKHGLIAAATECGGELVTAVAGDLDAPDWKAQLNTRAATAGVNAVACAIGKVLAALGDGSSLLSIPSRRRARGTAWLAAHRKLATAEVTN